MRKRWLLVSLVALMSVGCGEMLPVVRHRQAAPAATPQPTLDLDQIPVLGENPAPPVPLAATDPRFPIPTAAGGSLVSGKALYESYCAGCHGLDGEGQPPEPLAPGAAPPHNADGHTWHHPDQQNFLTVWQGRSATGAMPGFHTRLTPDEIIAILAYIKTWWLPDQLAHQMRQTSLIADP